MMVAANFLLKLCTASVLEGISEDRSQRNVNYGDVGINTGNRQNEE
jgi:hypothetical protein